MFDTGKMKKKVEELKKSGLIRKNEKILIAFSGGPDSVFLYNLLNFLKKEYSLEISLMYINHNLREDVGNDLKFVREFSEENNVPLYIESVNVKEYATENKKSIELAAREKLGLALPGEHVLILSKYPEEKEKEKAESSKPSNFTQWINFIFGGNAQKSTK